ncbi:MAG: hypothetical protein WCY56_07970 [Aminobacteriaceae bacterium]
MAKKPRPRLKNYLSTGRLYDDEPRSPREEAAEDLVGMLCEEDKKTWKRLFEAADTEFMPLDYVERREDFRTMDRDRFSLFRLEAPGAPLFHVRSSVQIREPLAALIKLDEAGKVYVYRP